MRELKAYEVKSVSGGAFNINQTVKDIYAFLRSDKNPLNGAVIGQVMSNIIRSVMYPVINFMISPWVKK